MKLVIIGTGNVAIQLGNRLIQSGVGVYQLIGRNEARLTSIAKAWDIAFSTTIDEAILTADGILIAVSDQAIANIVEQIPENFKGWVAHTAGAVSMSVINDRFTNAGVFYPLQSLTAETNSDVIIPIFIEASNEVVKTTLWELGQAMHSPVQYGNSLQRKKMHLAAVIANNFTNFLLALTQDYCEKEKIPFEALWPLLQETIDRLGSFPAREVQTGPAKRGDWSTLQAHEQLLKAHPQLQAVYGHLSEAIYQYYHSENNPV